MAKPAISYWLSLQDHHLYWHIAVYTLRVLQPRVEQVDVKHLCGT